MLVSVALLSLSSAAFAAGPDGIRDGAISATNSSAQGAALVTL
jgi:hypothetical protein